MKYIVFVCLVLMSCSKGYTPSEHLSAKEQDELMWKIIRYLAKPPEGLTKPERFYKGYDPYYQEQQARYRLDSYYMDDNTHYFLVSRIAPSIHEKRVATGGVAKFDENGKLIEYEEVFRTWKMKDADLKVKAGKLFDLMVKGESLEKYQTKFTAPEEYIEFPDDINYFDKSEREWKQRQP